MSPTVDRGRSRRRIVVEVAALGVLVLLAVVWTRQSGVGHGDDAAEPSPDSETEIAATEIAAPEAAPDPDPERATSHRSIPADPDAWRGMSAEDVAGVGRAVAARTPGFRFDRVQVFTGAGISNAIAVLVHERTDLEFSLIPPGSFSMGSPATEEGRTYWEGPAQHVTVVRPFLLSRTECSGRAWSLGLGRTPFAGEPGLDSAVAPADWQGVASWCGELGLRLPSETEWEYACRAGTTTRFWSGDEEADLARVGWYTANSGSVLQPVGQKPANPFGLHDVHGNVFEWCEDTWHDSYDGLPNHGAAWVDQASGNRVLRGGSLDSRVRDARSASRDQYHPALDWYDLGFRPACSVTAE